MVFFALLRKKSQISAFNALILFVLYGMVALQTVRNPIMAESGLNYLQTKNQKHTWFIV